MHDSPHSLHVLASIDKATTAPVSIRARGPSRLPEMPSVRVWIHLVLVDMAKRNRSAIHSGTPSKSESTNAICLRTEVSSDLVVLEELSEQFDCQSGHDDRRELQHRHGLLDDKWAIGNPHLARESQPAGGELMFKRRSWSGTAHDNAAAKRSDQAQQERGKALRRVARACRRRASDERGERCNSSGTAPASGSGPSHSRITPDRGTHAGWSQ